MSDIAVKPHTRSIVVDEVFPHKPEILWKAITTGALMARWIMEPDGFEPVVGNQFTYRTTPAGKWDGLIRCRVLEVVPNERFSYAWTGGHEDNVGYGSKLDTVVTFTLKKVQTGTRLHVEHAGFVLPRNDTAYNNMSGGWVRCVEKLDGVVRDQT